MNDLALAVISPSHTTDDEIGILVNLFSRGLEVYHFRKPEFSLERTAAFLDHIPERFHNRIVLHNHHRLVERFGLRGIHYTEARRKKELDRLSGIRRDRPGLTLSSSFHLIGDIERQGHVFDYLFLSPVFDSISKKNYTAAFDSIQLQAFLASWPRPVYALGGVDATRIPAVRKLGFSGAAVLGAVWEHNDPLQAFTVIKQAAEAGNTV
ncbi:MAG: thiamine phosphate synthase [Desulfobacterales bacterium]